MYLLPGNRNYVIKGAKGGVRKFCVIWLTVNYIVSYIEFPIYEVWNEWVILDTAMD